MRNITRLIKKLSCRMVVTLAFLAISSGAFAGTTSDYSSAVTDTSAWGMAAAQQTVNDPTRSATENYGSALTDANSWGTIPTPDPAWGPRIGASAETQEEIDNCHEQLRKEAQATTAFSMQVQRQLMNDGFERDAKMPTIPMRGSIIGKHCLDWVIDKNGFFKQLSDLFTPRGFWGFVGAVIRTLVMQVLDAACSYVAATLTNLMNSVCLPLPNFSLPKWDQPNFSAGTCNGLSFADVLSFSSNFATTSYPTTYHGIVNYARGRTRSGRVIH